jgi:acetyl-CoA C-acetyltransferase
MLSDKGSFYTDRELIRSARFVPMGLAADLIASLDGISREACDVYAARSQQRAGAARAAGAFCGSLISVVNPEANTLVTEDECIRPGTTASALSEFEPAFVEHAGLYRGAFKQAFSTLKELTHVHHKGNSPAVADGASLVLLGGPKLAGTCGLKPRARVRAMANASGHELLALTGGIDAARVALARAGIAADELDLVEFNEAFAAVTIKFSRDLALDPRIVNVNGGAIALGHAMGATGASLLGTLLDELERRDQSLGMVALSGAAGVGTAMVIERV